MSQMPKAPPSADAPFLLAGAPNFRSIASLPGTAGGRLRPDRLFRSDALNRLSDADLGRFAGLGIGAVLDLRRPDERGWAPSRLPSDPAPQTFVFDSPEELAAVRPSTWRNQLDSPHFDAAAASAWMIDTYTRLPDAFARSVRIAAERLGAAQPGTAPAQPVLVHCTAGKDRTGFVCAVLLSAVGVSWDDILADYLESSRRRPPRDLAMSLLGPGAIEPSERALSAVEVIAGVRPEFLVAAFDTLRATHGSLQAYLNTACGLDAPAVERLRHRLLV